MSNKKTEPIIRVAKAGDEAGIHDAHMRSIREVCVKDHGPEEIKGWGYRELGERWSEHIQNHHIWVIEQQGVIQGHAFIRIYDKEGVKHGHIHGLYLTPSVLGQGFGKKLMQMMLDRAKESGVSDLSLLSSITAHEFYKSFGFKDSALKKAIEIGGHSVTCFPMKMQIAND